MEFRETMKISAMTILFGLLSLIIGWLSAMAINPVARLYLGEIAVVLLVLFFYSLNTDRIDGLEERIKIISSKRGKTAKLVP